MFTTDPDELSALLDEANDTLAVTESMEQIGRLHAEAEAIRKYVQNMGLGLELENRASEVKLRAERKAGKVLAGLNLHGGDRKSSSHAESLKLENFGVSRNQSARWRQLASVSEALFREYIRTTNAAGERVTSADLVRLACERDGAGDHGDETACQSPSVEPPSETGAAARIRWTTLAHNERLQPARGW